MPVYWTQASSRCAMSFESLCTVRFGPCDLTGFTLLESTPSWINISSTSSSILTGRLSDLDLKVLTWTRIPLVNSLVTVLLLSIKGRQHLQYRDSNYTDRDRQESHRSPSHVSGVGEVCILACIFPDSWRLVEVDPCLTQSLGLNEKKEWNKRAICKSSVLQFFYRVLASRKPLVNLALQL